MKTTIFKRFAALALCAGMVSSTALAANTIYKNIRVEYSGIKLVVDGQTVVPKDANGKTVEPFIYNGTTYLPVRAVGNAVGKKVKWDAILGPFILAQHRTSRGTCIWSRIRRAV